MNLPVKKVTPTFLNTWDYSKSQWYDRYLLKKESTSSPRQLFGIMFDNAINETFEQGYPENPPANWDKVLEGIIILDELQTKVEQDIEINGQVITLSAIVDTHTTDFLRVVDHKTSTADWTVQKALESYQTKVICSILWIKYGVIPMMTYNHIKTKVLGDGAIVELTGFVDSVTVDVGEEYITNFLHYELPDLLNEISAVSTAFEHKDSMNLEGLEEYFNLKQEIDLLSKKADELRKSVINQLDAINAPYIRSEDYLIYRTSRKKMVPSGKAAAAQYKSAKKDLEELYINKGMIVPEESYSWTLKKTKDD